MDCRRKNAQKHYIFILHAFLGKYELNHTCYAGMQLNTQASGNENRLCSFSLCAAPALQYKKASRLSRDAVQGFLGNGFARYTKVWR